MKKFTKSAASIIQLTCIKRLIEVNVCVCVAVRWLLPDVCIIVMLINSHLIYLADELMICEN